MISENSIINGNNRYISGNVLTGTKISSDGNIGFYDYQITVIPEGDKQEFLGWIAPGLQKFSMSKSYFSWLKPTKKYNLNTNYNGEERAYVVTGQYEKVLPMDVYPMQLIKACMIEDIDAMEQLGIYEVSEEDMALCEFVCTSKMDVQNIIRKGLDLVKKECS
jgi:Na+-transporting NADH:ubiquinone oxidoreductase subunit A